MVYCSVLPYACELPPRPSGPWQDCVGISSLGERFTFAIPVGDVVLNRGDELLD